MSMVTIYQIAADSVRSRGFFDYATVGFQDPIANSLIARVIEEMCEFDHALRIGSQDRPQELADVLIATSAAAGYLEIDLAPADEMGGMEHPVTMIHLVGRLARAQRKSRLELEAALLTIVRHVRDLADLYGFDLETVAVEKMRSDEQRGYRHGEVTPRDEPGGGALVDVPRRRVQRNGTGR